MRSHVRLVRNALISVKTMNIDNITAMEYDDRPDFGHRKTINCLLLGALGSTGATCRMNVSRFTIVINYYVQLTYLWDQWTFSKRRGTLVYDTFELRRITRA